MHFGRGLRGTVIFGFGFYTCPHYLRLSAQYLRFQPALTVDYIVASGLTFWQTAVGRTKKKKKKKKERKNTDV